MKIHINILVIVGIANILMFGLWMAGMIFGDIYPWFNLKTYNPVQEATINFIPIAFIFISIITCKDIIKFHKSVSDWFNSQTSTLEVRK